ncbi:hypothetical protein ISN45_At03g034040 [Arabidopsis thaliana x Arabidopsis arenosa]|uniref:Arabidopsis retrotransposon Orf1 C-terminal domain-containing protein n=1 Tax=Arabidopsis thaliana x Arabidopsis arenosa TaxID=1240361 RepID=A0A8T2EXT3_9BRAS|nr:hypothetical protein ISN45_At03g034040 [Arabidopsis thaliana x Arabidopsis arenosa]
MDSRRKCSSRARRSSIDNEEVEAFDMSDMTEPQIRQAHRAQRSSLIQGGSSSRSTMQREEVARGKRVVEAEEEHHEEAPFEEVVSEEEVEIIGDDTPTPVWRRNRPRRKREPTLSKYYQYLKELKFEGTRCPHKETMQELGICGDLEYLMELANLATFMSYQSGGYKEESCQLLATLKVHFCVDDLEKEERGGLGYIIFKVRDVEYTIDICHLETIFGFPSGEGILQDYDQEELKSLWKTIAGPKSFSSTKSKSSSICNPVIRYLHQCIANTLFPKKATGFVSEEELCMIYQSLVFILRETKDWRKMAGDRADTSLSVVLLDHLLSFKEYAATIHRSGIRGSLCVGGLLTLILGAVSMEFGTPDVLPKFIDLDYLKGKNFLEKTTPADRYVFKFNHSEHEPSLLSLPCENRTSVKTRRNINFMPSPSALNIDIGGAREDEPEYSPADYEQHE